MTRMTWALALGVLGLGTFDARGQGWFPSSSGFADLGPSRGLNITFYKHSRKSILSVWGSYGVPAYAVYPAAAVPVVPVVPVSYVYYPPPPPTYVVVPVPLPSLPPPRQDPEPREGILIVPRNRQPAGAAAPRREPGPLPPLPEPDANPLRESARQIALGKGAFSQGEYGRAARRFHAALTAFPGDATAHFLQVQAQFALGKYREADAELRAGFRLQPNGPGDGFRPRDLYGAHAEFVEQMQQLTQAWDRHPEDVALLSLLAYQLWFDGRPAEARPLLQRVLALDPAATWVRPFLQAPPTPNP